MKGHFYLGNFRARSNTSDGSQKAIVLFSETPEDPVTDDVSTTYSRAGETSLCAGLREGMYTGSFQRCFMS